MYVLAATAFLGLAACGSSSSTETATDGGAKTESTEDAGSEFPPDAAPVDKTPIANLPAKTWQFVPVQGAMCRDGSATGFGVSANPASKNLMIYLEGGGACFNALTCGLNAKSFSESDFNACVTGSSAASCATSPSIAGGGAGIFDRTDATNPMADWNFVYVPFCTGDVHAGDKTNARSPA